MLSRDDIILRAEEAFDGNDFSSAVKGYRTAAKMACTRLPMILGNLVQAEEFVHLQFIQELKDTFPNSLEVRLHEAWYYVRINHPARSMILYSEMIEEGLSSGNEKSIRLSRLSVSRQS